MQPDSGCQKWTRGLSIMRFTGKSIFAATSLSLLAAVYAGTLAAQAPQAGVVTVSFNGAVLQTAEAQRELKALDAKYAPRQAQLKALNDQIGELQKQLEAAADKLSDAERASREQSLGAKQKQMQRDTEDFRSDTQSDSQLIFRGVAQKLYAFMQTYAKQHGYTMVVERGTDAAPVVWYAAGNLDITEALAKAYDAQPGTAGLGSLGTGPVGPGGPGSNPTPKPQAAPAPK